MKVNKNLPNYLCITRIVLIPFVLLFLLDNPVVNGIPVYIRMLVSGAVFRHCDAHGHGGRKDSEKI